MQSQNLLGTALGGALLNTLVNTITDKLIHAPTVPVTRDNVVIVKPEIREAVAEAIVKDPVILNELNGEQPIQSRVLWGNTIATIGTALATFLPILVALGWITAEQSQTILDGWGALVPVVGAVVTIAGIGYSFYGRLATGLKPLFSRKAAGA